MRILALPLMLLAFQGAIQPLPAPLRTELAAHRWHPGCPVPLSRLRLLTVTYWGLDRRVHTGQLVVNRAVAGPLLSVFQRLYRLHFSIRRMRPVDASADDTSAFDCRRAVPSPCPGATATGHWSEHAYGEAVDINPIENPYTGCGRTRQRASIPYLDRSHLRKGMVTPAVVAAFRSIGWGWGGNWTGTKDYMHFSATGH
jgi:D-alanyl-D-alanine carboxypeptidase